MQSGIVVGKWTFLWAVQYRQVVEAAFVRYREVVEAAFVRYREVVEVASVQYREAVAAFQCRQPVVILW